jgi:rhodanese-related sulfurtransferase
MVHRWDKWSFTKPVQKSSIAPFKSISSSQRTTLVQTIHSPCPPKPRVKIQKTQLSGAIMDILTIARQRGAEKQLPYAGAVTPAEAYALLKQDPYAVLVDVRTNAERDWVGRVAVSEPQHIAVEWNVYPGGTPNPAFLDELSRVAPKDKVLLFLCRSGVRSRHAAKLATENGYVNSFDILEGFEGDKDAEGHRKTVGGWCKAGLPWLGA